MLERHNVPGGCASFFQRDGYRFDVGATLASGFGSRGVQRILNARLGVVVSPEVTEPAMVVHLPGVSVTRHGDQRWRAERLRVFGPSAEPFWHAQERIAELAWDFSKDAPPLPVDAASIAAFLRALRPGHLPLALTLGRNVASIMPRPVPAPLRAFVDAQLLITAQTDAAHADLAYGCTALDLAREGTYHLADGISTIAESLARAVRRLGGRIRYNAVVGAIETERGRVHAVASPTARASPATESSPPSPSKTPQPSARRSPSSFAPASPPCPSAGEPSPYIAACRPASSRRRRRSTTNSSPNTTRRPAKATRSSSRFPDPPIAAAPATAVAPSPSRRIRTSRAGNALTATTARPRYAPTTRAASSPPSTAFSPPPPPGPRSSSPPTLTRSPATPAATAAWSAARPKPPPPPSSTPNPTALPSAACMSPATPPSPAKAP